MPGATKRILTYLMHDSVAQHYSWIGNKGKEKFRDLNITPVLMSMLFTRILNGGQNTN